MITVRSTINLAHQSVPEVIPVVQGDTGRSILFSLADFTIPTGATARYFITKPSGLAVYNDATIDGNTVLVDLTAQSLAEYGDCPGQVRISVGDTVVTSFEFILHVEPFRGIDAVESTNETNIFDQAIEEAEEYISQAIDPTLTIANKAADAKAAGDFIWSIFPTESARGNPASFDDGADNIPVKDLQVTIVPHQDLHGYDKPWAGGAGANKCNYSSTTVANITFSADSDGYISASPNNSDPRGWVYINAQYKMTLPAGDYNLIVDVKTAATPLAQTILILKDNNEPVAEFQTFLSSATKHVGQFSLSETTNIGLMIKQYDGVFRIAVSDRSVTDWTPYENICPITGTEEVGVEVADDEETKAEYTIPLDRTVYGGTLDVTTGVLTVDKAMIDMGADLAYSRNTSYEHPYFVASITGANESGTSLSTAYKYGTFTQVVANNGYFTIVSNTVRVRNDAYTDASAFQTAMNGQKLVYTIAAPQTYQLTPQEVRSLYGVNHISTDCESVDVIYRADIGLYIGKLIPSAQTLSMARPTLMMQTPIAPQTEDEILEESEALDEEFDTDVEDMMDDIEENEEE